MQRFAEAGAEAYLPTSTIELLATGVDRAVTRRQITDRTPPELAIELQ